MRPSLDIQLKASTILGDSGDDEYQYPLRLRNYDLLRGQSLVPRILVVLDLPVDERQWISVSTDELVLRRCAYWANIKGFPSTQNTSTVTVRIK